MKNSYLKNFFNDHFKKLNLNKNDNLVLHADLSTFGIIDNKIYKIVLEILIKLIGKNGTIIMPSYDLCNKSYYIYDYKKVNENNGRLVKLFSKRSDVVKSKSLIHSHLGFGKKSSILKKSKIDKSFGKNTDFDFFVREKFKLILLGCKPSIGATILHHFEFEAKVPYRKKIVIIKNYLFKNKIKKIKYHYFARSKNYKFDIDRAFKDIVETAKSSKKIRNKFGESYSIDLKEMKNITINLFKKNINFLIKK